MSTSHHLTAETLVDYAAGALAAPMETLVACHLTVCAACRSRASLADDLGGAELHASEPVAPRLSATALLAGATAHSASTIPAPTQPTPAAVTGDVPRPLARLLPTSVDELDWRRVAPGIKQFNLSEEPRRNGAFKLLHLAPGVVLSGHTHNERELTYVVRGSYQDVVGRFRAGDIADLDGDVVHQPVVDTDEPCIALIATDSPVRYTGMFGRLMQPFVGI